MHHGSGVRAASNILAVAVIVGLIVYGLEACGLRTGIPEFAVCKVGTAVVLGPIRGLLPIGLTIGFMLLLIRATRGAGVTAMGLCIGGMVLVEVWQQQAGGYCGFTGGSGFTP